MKKSIILSFAFIHLLLFNVAAQNDKETFFNIIEEDRSSVDALVLYPEGTRNAILEASLHPEVLIKLENVQQQTKQEFVKLIENRPIEEQQDIYDLSRYNGLINQLGEGKRKSEEEIRDILKDYPEEIHETAMRLERQQHGLLKSIRELDLAAQETFNKILSEYPQETQEAYRHLITLPEVIEILAQNMRMTVTLGDVYKNNPAWVKNKLDSLSLEAARQNVQEVEEWKKRLEDDPELLEQFQSSAEEYAKDKGFEEEEYSSERTEIQQVVYHHYYSYPFWFSYPWWYPYSYWYRWPVWYDWGFYYGPGRTIVLIGLPSFYYTYWFCYHPRHHYYYPRLSNTFLTHYENHPRSATGISAGVGTWIRDNRDIIPGNLFVDDGQRMERIKEFGLFEMEYRERVEKRPGRTISRDEFLRNNTKRFERLALPGVNPQTLKAERPTRELPREKEAPVKLPDDVERSLPERQREIERERRERETPPPISPDEPIKREPPEERQRPVERPTPPPPPPDKKEAPQPKRKTPPERKPAPKQKEQRKPGRPSSIQIVPPTNGQAMDMAKTYHFLNWKR